MSLRKAARIDKKIIAHLTHGGSITDVVAESLISGLLRESLENKAIANAVAFHRIPVSLLVRVYQESFQELLPSPLIRHGNIILVPSLPFIDEDNFPIILDTLCGLSKFSPDNPLSEEMFVTVAVQQAVMIFESWRARRSGLSVRFRDPQRGLGTAAWVPL